MNPEILFETADYFVINKPPGMACEPPSHEPTLRDFLIEEGRIDPADWGPDDRSGIVHRLDTDTSGVMIWAKTPAAQTELKQKWQGRQVKKTYLALVAGQTEPSGTIELSLERDNQNDRQRVAMLPTVKSRPAITTYKTLEQTTVGEWGVSFVEAHPVTGRTHQIRVHFKAINHPIVGDKLYGEKASDELARKLDARRQFLHASHIELSPNEIYEAPLPADLLAVLNLAQLKSPPAA